MDPALNVCTGRVLLMRNKVKQVNSLDIDLLQTKYTQCMGNIKVHQL